MTEDFCKRIARRTRKFGYAPKESVRISRFCYVSMLSVCGALLFVSYQRRAGVEKESSGSFDPMMGAMLDPSLVSLAEEDDISLRQMSFCVPSQGMNILATGSGDFSLGAPAGIISPVSSRIHRR